MKLQPELKYLDQQIELKCHNDPSTGTGIASLNDQIIRGSGVYERIGNRTKMNYIQIQGVTKMLVNEESDSQPRWIRFFVVHDRQPTGNKIVLGDLLRSSTAGQSDANPFHAFTNVNNKQRFTILLSKKLNLPNQQIVETGDQDYIARFPGKGFSYYVKIPAKCAMSTYGASTASITDVTSGLFYVVAVSNARNGTDTSTGNDVYPLMNMRVRQCYYG